MKTHHMKPYIFTAFLFCIFFYTIPVFCEDFTLRHGDRTQPRIAITIDDCYDSNCVLAAVELCEAYNIPITFFPIGNALKYADSELWQRALDAGCEIGNHSWGHKDLTELSDRQIRFQLLRTQQKLDEMLGYHYPMQLMRPPFGSTNTRVANAALSVGYMNIVKWDVDQPDAKKAFRNTKNGSILLYHARAKDIRCLKTSIPELIKRGYICVTVSELLCLPPVIPCEGIYQYTPSDALLSDANSLQDFHFSLSY